MNDTPSTSTELIPQQTLHDMALAYSQALAELKAGLEAIEAARAKVTLAFGKEFRLPSERYWNGTLPSMDAIELSWRQEAWQSLVDKMELKRVCSVKKANEIDAQIADPKTLPEIKYATMIAMLESNVSSMTDFFQQAVVECFDSLRPWRWGDKGDGYKSNTVYQVNEKIVLTYACSQGYSRNASFRVCYSGDTTQKLRCLDNVMHILDGKGTVPTHAGPLVDALNSDQNQGRVETAYFEAKCFKNQNIHLRFKRLDLLAEFNRIGSGGAWQLPGEKKPTGTKKTAKDPTPPAPGDRQAFFTPRQLAMRMAELADVRCQDVLEPSAGLGSLAQACVDAGAHAVECIEIDGEDARHLRESGFEVHRCDFLTWNTPRRFSRIVMNPPFANGHDIAHITHAWHFLQPGGRLVALCAAGPRQHEKLKPWVEALGGTWEVLPEGSFKESGTMANVALLVVDAPSVSGPEKMAHPLQAELCGV